MGLLCWLHGWLILCPVGLGEKFALKFQLTMGTARKTLKSNSKSTGSVLSRTGRAFCENTTIDGFAYWIDSGTNHVEFATYLPRYEFRFH